MIKNWKKIMLSCIVVLLFSAIYVLWILLKVSNGKNFSMFLGILTVIVPVWVINYIWKKNSVES